MAYLPNSCIILLSFEILNSLLKTNKEPTNDLSVHSCSIPESLPLLRGICVYIAYIDINDNQFHVHIGVKTYPFHAKQSKLPNVNLFKFNTITHIILHMLLH